MQKVPVSACIFFLFEYVLYSQTLN